MRKFAFGLVLLLLVGGAVFVSFRNVDAYRAAGSQADLQNFMAGLNSYGSSGPAATIPSDYYQRQMRQPTPIEYFLADAGTVVGVGLVGLVILIVFGWPVVSWVVRTTATAALAGAVIKKSVQATPKGSGVDASAVGRRLDELGVLRSSGRISEAEYEAKRKQILAEL